MDLSWVKVYCKITSNRQTLHVLLMWVDCMDIYKKVIGKLLDLVLIREKYNFPSMYCIIFIRSDSEFFKMVLVNI